MRTHKKQEPIIEAKHLSRVVDEKALVHAVSFQVYAGDVIAIIGPSGAGKSSLLRLLNRLDEPTNGTVLYMGKDYRQLNPRSLRRKIAMVMQQPYLFPGTVAQNLAFGPKQHGEHVSEDRMQELLERVGLDGFGSRNVSQLSGGEAQRVSLARTLANSPEVLLLDEPTPSLDADTQQDVERLICSILRQQHLTCIMVTHDMDQAHRMAKQAILLREGQLVQMGSVTEVLDA